MQQGLVLMIVGMGTVFGFLILMVACMHAAARFFNTFAAWFPEPAAPAASRAPVTDNLAEIAAAVAAVRAHTGSKI